MRIEIPTTLSDECIVRFRDIYRKKYGVELNTEEANAEALKVMAFMAIVIDNMDSVYGN